MTEEEFYWLKKNGLTVEEYNFRVLLPRLEREILKFIDLTPETFLKYIRKYKNSSLLTAPRRCINTKDMTYRAVCFRKEVDYNHKNKKLVITKDNHDGTVVVSHYKLNDQCDFEPCII